MRFFFFTNKETIQRLLTNNKTEANQVQLTEIFQEFTAIDAIIDRLQASIPPPEHITHFHPEKARRLAVAYSLINVAIIHLHRPFSQRSETSHRKRLASAEVILDIIAYIKPGHPSHINPIMGVSFFFLMISSFQAYINSNRMRFFQIIWTEAAQVIFDEITMIRSSLYSSSPLAGSNGAPDAMLFNTVYQALLSMNDFCTHLQVPLLCKPAFLLKSRSLSEKN